MSEQIMVLAADFDSVEKRGATQTFSKMFGVSARVPVPPISLFAETAAAAADAAAVKTARR